MLERLRYEGLDVIRELLPRLWLAVVGAIRRKLRVRDGDADGRWGLRVHYAVLGLVVTFAVTSIGLQLLPVSPALKQGGYSIIFVALAIWSSETVLSLQYGFPVSREAARRGFLARHPVVSLSGLLLLAVIGVVAVPSSSLLMVWGEANLGFASPLVTALLATFWAPVLLAVSRPVQLLRGIGDARWRLLPSIRSVVNRLFVEPYRELRTVAREVRNELPTLIREMREHLQDK